MKGKGKCKGKGGKGKGKGMGNGWSHGATRVGLARGSGKATDSWAYTRPQNWGKC